MTVATYKLEVDWDNDGTFDGGDEDVTARLLNIEWSRGRDFASGLTGRASGGALIATLNNQSGDYSSFNTSSPIFNDILPGRVVRLQATDVTSTVTLWQGHLSRISPQPEVSGPNTALLEAIGPLAYINQKKVQLEKQGSALTGALVGEVLDEVGWPADDRDIDDGQSTVSKFLPEDDTKALQLLRELEETEKGFLHESRTGQIIFEDRNRRLSGDYIVSQATFSDASGAARSYSRVIQADPLPEIFNRFEAKVHQYATASIAVLWTLPFTGSDSPRILAGASITFTATPAEAVPVTVEVDEWTTPATTTDYTINSQADGAGTDLLSSTGLSVIKRGFRMEITLTNNQASTTAYVTKLQARGTAVTRKDPLLLSVDNDSSQTLFGKRTYVDVAKHLNDPDDAIAHLQYMSQIYSVPKPILTITVEGNRDANHLSEVLRRDISDRITIIGANDAGLGVAEEFIIEAEKHTIDAQLNHQAVYECAGGAAFGSAWILNTSALNLSTKLFF